MFLALFILPLCTLHSTPTAPLWFRLSSFLSWITPIDFWPVHFPPNHNLNWQVDLSTVHIWACYSSDQNCSLAPHCLYNKVQSPREPLQIICGDRWDTHETQKHLGVRGGNTTGPLWPLLGSALPLPLSLLPPSKPCALNTSNSLGWSQIICINLVASDRNPIWANLGNKKCSLTHRSKELLQGGWEKSPRN